MKILNNSFTSITSFFVPFLQKRKDYEIPQTFTSVYELNMQKIIGSISDNTLKNAQDFYHTSRSEFDPLVNP